MERDFGVEQLFCSCSKPPVTVLESGNHWCDDCGGLVPEEKAWERSRTAEDITEDVEARGYKGSKKIVGPALFVCSFCNHHDWGKFDMDLPAVMKALQRTRMIQCVSCGKNNGVAKAWEGMIK